jgi:lipopolysaccharide transport system permease protein
MMATIASQLMQSRDLLWAWTDRTIRARYQQSVLGGLWIIIQPLMMVILFSAIFTYFVPIDTGTIPYPVFSYVGLIPWTLFANSLYDMSDSLVSNMGLVTKIYFPREILPLAALLARLLDFAVALTLLVLLMVWFRVPLFPPGWLFLPMILAIQLTFIVGAGLLLAAANVFYRDVRSALALVMQLLFYASPIIYPVSVVPEHLRPFYFLNPMAGVLEAYRSVLLYQSLPGPYLYISALMAVVVFIFGYWFFKRVEFQIADLI